MNEYFVCVIDSATKVEIGIYVISFYSIDEQTMVCISEVHSGSRF